MGIPTTATERRGRRLAAALATLLLPLLLGAAPARGAAGAPCSGIEMFSRAGCPHCAQGRAFLAELRAERPELAVRVSDVETDPAALGRLRALYERHGVVAGGVPTFDVCGELVIGFESAETTGLRLRELLGGAAEVDAAVELPLFGRLDVTRLGLPLFTLAVGLVDGFNPCAMWVLLVLLSVLVNVRDRRKLLAVAGTFVLVSALAYYAFMAAWLNVFLLVGWSRASELALGGIAVAIGLVHLKDLVAFGRGPSLSIPDSAKPLLYRRIRAILSAPSLPAALAGAGVLAVLVNVVELLCTAGLPAVYTRILTLQGLPPVKYYAYLALYDLAYMADDLVMVTIVVVTLDRLKLQERAGRWLKGLSGAVMLALGLYLLL